MDTTLLCLLTRRRLVQEKRKIPSLRFPWNRRVVTHSPFVPQHSKDFTIRMLAMIALQKWHLGSISISTQQAPKPGRGRGQGWAVLPLISTMRIQMKVLISCGGVPILTLKEDQFPSTPSQSPSGSIDRGAGTVVVCVSRGRTTSARACDTLSASKALGNRSSRSSMEGILGLDFRFQRSKSDPNGVHNVRPFAVPASG